MTGFCEYDIIKNQFRDTREVYPVLGVSKVAERAFQSCIISGGTMEAAVDRALELAAAAVCISPGKRPCGLCRACRKLRRGIHPDVKRISPPLDDSGKPKRELLVDQIRELIADAYILPNEAERKVYIIEYAELMNTSAQNAALKLLEEPPAGAVILLCTLNPSALLPTVRSRCAFFNSGGAENEADRETAELALEFLRKLGQSRTELCSFCFAHEGMDNASMRSFIACTLDITADMLTRRRDSMGLDRARLLRLSELLRKCEEYLKVNTSVKHIFGLLAVRAG